jgi:hypothetical protein
MKLTRRAVAAVATAISVVVLVSPAVASANVKVLPTTLPNGGVGQYYSQTLTATRGVAPYTFSVTRGSLPAGLTLDPDGTLSGTAPTNESSSFVVQATDSSSPAMTGTQRYTLTFGVVFATLHVPSANVNSSYSDQLVVKGGTAPYSFSVTSGSLPPGLTLSPSGLLSGTTTSTPGHWSFTVGVADSGSPQQTNSRKYTITVLPVGQWTLCMYTAKGTTVDNVTLAGDGTVTDTSGKTGTWLFDKYDHLQMAFGHDFYGKWAGANNQFAGGFFDISGSWAMIQGFNNAASCVQPTSTS